jgi:nickel-dependent lactate racemase
LVRVSIPYHGKDLLVDLDDHRVAGVLGPNPVPARDEQGVLSGSLAGSAGSFPLEAFLSGSRNPLFIVNDADRDTPTSKVLDVIWPFIPADRTRFLVAAGTHPLPSDQELAALFGKRFESVRRTVTVHDARNDDAMVYLGRTARGTDVRLNRLFFEADRVVVIGSVEPHYFAGWTGGRKALLPGIAAYSSIEQNHRLALEQGVAVLALDGNPVHEDVMEAAGLAAAKPVFSIQTVLDAGARICFASSGGLHDTFHAAVEFAKGVYCVPVTGKADVVVAVAAPPLDQDLYQAHKAVENVRSVLNEGGILILVAACPRGVGNDAFVRLMQKAGSPADVFARLKQGYRLGYHKAARLAGLMAHAEVWGVTGLEPELLQSIFIRPFKSLQEAVDQAMRKKPEGRVLFVNSATTVVPMVKRKE